jgi:hypothetical protein
LPAEGEVRPGYTLQIRVFRGLPIHRVTGPLGVHNYGYYFLRRTVTEVLGTLP